MTKITPSKTKLLSQVFLKDRDLVTSLVRRSSITNYDTVLEIGPGKGIITDELAKTTGKLIAVERDNKFYQELLDKYIGNHRVNLYNADILSFSLPDDHYKVFSNIPFAIEGRLIRKLIDDPYNPPEDAYLVMRREVAERLAGTPREGQFSVLHKPWFNLEIFHNFKRGDFKPEPKVESSMFRFTKRDDPFVNRQDKKLYEFFIKAGFEGGRRLSQNLSPVFSGNQLNKLAQDFGFRTNDMPTKLTFQQWLGMFEFLLHGVSQEQRRKFISRMR